MTKSKKAEASLGRGANSLEVEGPLPRGKVVQGTNQKLVLRPLARAEQLPSVQLWTQKVHSGKCFEYGKNIPKPCYI
jgi:hypothetical protein